MGNELFWRGLVTGLIAGLLLSTLAIKLTDSETRRAIRHCLAEHLYRCDIGETQVFITYGNDAGPDR